MKLLLVLSLFLGQALCANIFGSAIGSGVTKASAYAEALSQLPIGASVYKKLTCGADGNWLVRLYWRK
jgi:hypothetical protein